MKDRELRPPDLQNLIGQDTGRDHLSTTKLSTSLNCLRRYQHRYLDRLQPIARPAALTLGKAFHASVEARDPMAGVNAMVKEAQPTSREDQERLDIDSTIVAAASQAYLARYDDEGIQREVGYRIRLRSPYTGAPSRTFDLLGYADGVVDCGSFLELVEDKFVGRIDGVSVKRVKLDRQVGLECYALWRITGKPVRRIRYRFTKKPAIKRRQNEGHEEFLARLMDDYRERPDFYLHEEVSFRDADDLLEIETELWAWAEQIRQADHHGFYPRNTSACADYGGCPFRDLCTQGQDAMGLYEVRAERLEQAA
jgi:hypothetical protein